MPVVRCARFSRPRLFPLAGAIALASALLLPTACSDDQPTAPAGDKHPLRTSETSTGFLRDDFTDVDGTRIVDHTPDGGSEPFSWVRSATPGEAVAIIQDNGLLADVSNQGFYLPSRPTGDWVELTLDVGPGASTVFHDVIIYLRTSETLRTADGAYPAYEVRWSIGPEPANWLYVFSFETGSAMRQSVHAPPGLHTLRAEISGGTMQVSVDGQVLLTHPLGPLLPPDRTAIGIWANGPPSVKITSFSAGTNAPPLTCTPSVQRGQLVTCALSPSTSGDVTGWEFTPAAGTSSLPPVQDTSTSREWKGIAAVGGVARVRVTDGSTQHTFEASFTVTDRPSLWSSMWSYRQGPEPLVPDVDPHGGVLLGRNCPEILLCVPTLRVQPDPTTPGAGYTAAAIGSGPNKGYWHVAAQMWNMKRVANVNPAMLPGSPRTHPLPKKTPKQCRQALGFAPNATAFANFFQYNDKCQSINMTAFVDGVWGHEGFGYNGGQGHESLARTAAAEPQNDPYTAIESLVYPDSATLESVVRSKVVPIAIDITQRSADPNPSGNRAPGPIWFWDAGPATYNLYHIAGF